MAKSYRDLWYVALKVFLERNGQFFIFRDKYGDWDIPGGRIQRHEFGVSFERIIARKLQEEVGPGVRYRLGKPAVFMRHERTEASLKKRVRIFAVGYTAKYVSGEIRLSPQHTEYRWVSRKTFKAGRYFRGGWLMGVREYVRQRKL